MTQYNACFFDPAGKELHNLAINFENDKQAKNKCEVLARMSSYRVIEVVNTVTGDDVSEGEFQ